MTTDEANFGHALHKSIKKSIAVILLVVMVMSMVPLAFAERGRSDARINSRIAVRADIDDDTDEDTDREDDEGALVGFPAEGETLLRVRGRERSQERSGNSMMPPGQWRKEYFHKQMKEYQDKFKDMFTQCMAQCSATTTVTSTDTLQITGTTESECQVQCKSGAQDYYEQVRGQMMGEFETYRDQYTESRPRSGGSGALGQETLWMPPEMMPPEFAAEMMEEDDNEVETNIRSDLKIKASTKARTRAEGSPAVVLPASDEAFERARGELEEARKNYQLARQHYEEAQQRFAEQKGRLQELRDDFKVCEKQSKKGETASGECAETKKEFNKESKEFLLKTAELVYEAVNKVKQRISMSEELTAEEKQKMLEMLEQRVKEVDNAVVVVNSLDETTPREEYKKAAKIIKETLQGIRFMLKQNVGVLAEAKLGNIISHLAKLKEQFEKKRDKLAEDGKDTASLDKYLKEFDSNVKLAQDLYLDAQVKFKQAKEDQSPQLVKEAHELLKKSRYYVKQARNTLRSIVKELKNQGGMPSVIVPIPVPSGSEPAQDVIVETEEETEVDATAAVSGTA